MVYETGGKREWFSKWIKRIFFLTVFLVLQAIPLSAMESFQVIAGEITVEGLHSIEREELLYLLDIGPGEAVDVISVRKGIKRAFLKGIFENITVEVLDRETGAMRITVDERDRVEEIIIEGQDRVSGRFIKKNLDIKEGEFLRYDLIEEYRYRLLGLINLRGFPFASVDIRVQPAEAPDRVKVIVAVKEGEPVIVKEIDILGRPEFEVLGMMRLEAGDIYDQMKFRDDVEKLENHYRKQGYLNPLVGPYTFKDGVLRLKVNIGKRLRVRITGNESIRSKTLKNVMPFFEAGDVRDDLINEAVDGMISLYHEKGYPNAQVAPVIKEEPDDILLNFYVFEGDKVLVESITVTGTTVPENKIKEIMKLKEGRAFDPELLEEDIQTIREFYIALGYRDAAVKKPEVDITEKWVRIRIEIVENEKLIISNISFKGVEVFQVDEFYDRLNIKIGDPYNDVDVSEARRTILAIYRSRGYYECEVDVARELAPEGARIVFSIFEGEQFFFGKTIVSGNVDTKLAVIKRELKYEEGAPLDPSKLADTRQRLLKLGLFSSIAISTLERSDHMVDIKIEVQEGKAGTFEFGFGYGEYDRYRGFFDVSYRNLFGMNRQISFRTEISSLATRFIVTFREPYLFGRSIESRSLFLNEDRKEKNVDTGEIRYRIKRNTASTGIEKKLGDRFKVNLFYEYSLVETTDVQPDVVLSPEDTGTLAISSLSPGIVFDTRDDPFDPQRGIFAGLTVKTATNLLLSETDFVKVTARLSGYQRLAKWLVAAVSLRGGAAGGLRETEELPIVERFFLGGRNTVRGYDQDTLGPKSAEGTPIGGNAFLLVNFELRTRVLRNWRIVPFVDGGNVWTIIDDMNPDELKYSAGLGIQYNTPVGPFRLDYGYKLQREPDESPSELHFSLGHAF